LKYKVLIIGYGSIGRRHAEILSTMPQVQTLRVVSSQKDLPFTTYQDIEQSLSYDPDYIVIANSTALHYQTLNKLEELFSEKRILVEKPIFEKHYPVKFIKNKIWVGYNLRFNPIIQMIKKEVSNRKIWAVQSTCVSFLPGWRNNIDYKDSSSAFKKSGGGVLLDLSHELDYLCWLFGEITIEHASLGRLSNLKIETEDYVMLQGCTLHQTKVHVYLNYFSKISSRELIIDGEGISIKADLLNLKAEINRDDQAISIDLSSNTKNRTYELLHEEVLTSTSNFACHYLDGINLMKVIDQARGKCQSI
tara:strand:- start:263 stop:1180 length:918 start_codon:yes stop_codon:yes gene_type:complete